MAELRAIADYRNSIVDFERVQEAGGGVVFSVASARSAARSGQDSTSIGQGSAAGGQGGNNTP